MPTSWAASVRPNQLQPWRADPYSIPAWPVGLPDPATSCGRKLPPDKGPCFYPTMLADLPGAVSAWLHATPFCMYCRTNMHSCETT